MKKRQFWSLFTLVLVLSMFISGCAGMSRIDSFFNNGEYLQHAKMIDFGLFFVIFLSMTYLGFSMVWGKGFGKPGEAKGPIMGLSISLSLIFALAIVTQTGFSITTMFPLAKAFFFLIIFFILYGLIVMTKIFGDHWGGKIAAAILAAMLAYILFSIFTHMVCQMSNNMDDPACQSDFFNAGYTLLGRWLGIDEWTFGGGGYYGSSSSSGGSSGSSSLDNFWRWLRGPGPSGGGGGGVTPTPKPVREGEIMGGCRLDITFQHDSAIPISGAAQVAEYVKRVKGMGKSKIYVYGFASVEGGRSHNYGLSYARAKYVGNMIKKLDSSMGASPKPLGEEYRFDPDSLPPNRRVVLSTDSISPRDNFAPAPGAGTLHNCTEAPEQTCSNNQQEGTEECDGTDDSQCPGKCKSDCTCEGDGPSPWWLLLLIPLLLLLFAVKRKHRIKHELMITIKENFLREIEKIRARKVLAWHSIIALNPNEMGDQEVHDRADKLIDTLNHELESKGWVSMRQLAKRYKNNLDRIKTEAVAFNNSSDLVEKHRDEKHIDMIVKILKEMKRRDALGISDKTLFYNKMREVTRAMLHDNKAKNEYQEFYRWQVRLRKEVEKFSAHEEKFLTQFREAQYSTFFGKRFWGTRHIVKNVNQATGRTKWHWPLTTKSEVLGDLQEHIGATPPDHGIVMVTTEVRNLCAELLAKIQEVIEEEENAKHDANTRTEFNRKFDEEQVIIGRLMEAIKLERRLLSEEWWPVLDRLRPEQGRMEGHIHYRRY